MPLVTTKEMFRKAYDGGYAIGAFNVNNMEIVQGITEACAMEQNAPVILQVSKGARAYANHTLSGQAGRSGTAGIEPGYPHRPASGSRPVFRDCARPASTAASPPS